MQSAVDFEICRSVSLQSGKVVNVAVHNQESSCHLFGSGLCQSGVLGDPDKNPVCCAVLTLGSSSWFAICCVQLTWQCLGPSGRPSLANRLLPAARGATIVGEGFPNAWGAICNSGFFSYAISLVLMCTTSTCCTTFLRRLSHGTTPRLELSSCSPACSLFEHRVLR